MNKAIKIALAVLATAGIVLAAGTTSTNDQSTVVYSTGVFALTGGVQKISWTETPYTNLTVVEVQSYNTALSISCRVHSSTLYFKTNATTATAFLAATSPWKQLTCTAENTNAIIFPLSIAAGQYIELWNPQTAGVNVSVKVR